MQLFKKRAIEALRDHKGKMPTPSEVMELSKLMPDIRTNVKVETFDALTGKLKDFDEGHNFLSIDGQYYLKQIQKFAFNHQNPKNSMRFADLDKDEYQNTWSGLWKNLYLTDSAMPESPSTEIDIPGNLVGYADKLPYSGTDILRGAINQNESYANEDISRFVFDFGTDRANGTIQSVGFCRDKIISNTMYATMLSNCDTVTDDVPISLQYSHLHHSGGILYGLLSGNKLYRIDKSTGVGTLIITLPQIVYVQMCIVGNYIYYGSATNKGHLVKTNLTTGETVSIIPYNTNNYVEGVCSPDGQFLYVTINSNATFYKIDLTTFTVVNQKSSSGLSGTSLFTYNGMLLASNSQTMYLPTPYNSQYYSKYGLSRIDTTSLAYDSSVLQIVTHIQMSSLSVIDDDGRLYYCNNRSGYYNGSNIITGYYLTSFLTSSYRSRNMITRKRLDAPIVKDNTKTLKVTYDIMFT